MEAFQLSYALYQELAGDIQEPLVEEGLTLELRFELYTSKLKYLDLMYEKCFLAINKNPETEDNYNIHDLEIIKKAIHATHEHIRQTILDSLQRSLKTVGKNTP